MQITLNAFSCFKFYVLYNFGILQREILHRIQVNVLIQLRQCKA